jgi:type I restriction enzyme, S subunit
MQCDSMVKLRDCVQFQTGHPFKSQHYVSDESGIRLLRGDNIAQGSLRWADAKRWPLDLAWNLDEFLLKDGDVVVAMDRPWIPAGLKFARIRSGDLPCLLVQRVARLRAGRGITPEFLNCVIGSRTFTEYVVGVQTGTAVPHLSGKQILDFEFRLPPIDEQVRIGKLLSRLEDRIHLLHETSKTLEALAQTLFRSWFIDFEPVHEKSRGLTCDGLSAEMASLFPAAFVPSESGLIPIGWQARSLDSIAQYLNGLALQKFPPESDSEFLPVIKIAQLRAGHVQGADRASSKLKSEYIVEDGDVLFSWSGTLEVEFWCGGRGALNQHLFKVSSKELPRWFYYLATRHHLPGFREIAAHKATTMGHIQRKHLTDARIAVPPPELLAVASRLLAPLLDRRVTNAIQARKLEEIVDTLLPRLMSGEMPVAQVTMAFEEVAA